MIKINNKNENRIRQGDILKDIEYIEYAIEMKVLLKYQKLFFLML